MVALPSEGVPLGTIARSESGQSSAGVEESERRNARIARFIEQAEARRLLPDERVSKCLRAVRPDVRDVQVWHSPEHNSAQYHGLMVCGSVWLCPVCASLITSRRQGELSQGLAYVRSHDLHAVMESFTFSHTRYDRLGDILPAFLDAQRRFNTGRRADAIRRRYGLVGSVRALEVTYGDESGWHPHGHNLPILPREADVEGFTSERRALWREVCASLGLYADEQHGYQLRDADEFAAQYVAKYGHAPRWDADAELSKLHTKRGHGMRCTPFDLLRYSVAGDGPAGSRFIEYAAAFKGKRQLCWSSGLRDLLQVGAEVTDAEIAARVEADAYLLGRLTVGQWRRVLANDARAEVLNAAATGSWAAVLDVLSSIGALEGVLSWRGRFEDGQVMPAE